MRLEFSFIAITRMLMMLRVCRYTLEAEEGRDMMLLDALIQLKEKDPACRSAAPAVKVCAVPTV